MEYTPETVVAELLNMLRSEASRDLSPEQCGVLSYAASYIETDQRMHKKLMAEVYIK